MAQKKTSVISHKTGSKITLVDKKTAQKAMDLLCATYPDADCELNYDSDFQLLIAVILSAQCTDQTINKVTAKLFKAYPTAQDLSEADIEHIKELIKASGYYNAKAKNIQACAQMLATKYGGVVPTEHDKLTELPGVGRKTANVVLGVAHGKPGWSVDTHVQRLCHRLGFSKELDPNKIELDLQKLFPGQDWSKLSITIIWHGRRLCFARKPNCAACPVKALCPSADSIK
jgi:endonuclease-3